MENTEITFTVVTIAAPCAFCGKPAVKARVWPVEDIEMYEGCYYMEPCCADCHVGMERKDNVEFESFFIQFTPGLPCAFRNKMRSY